MTTRSLDKRLIVLERGTWAETSFQIDDPAEFNLGKLGLFLRVLRRKKELSMAALAREVGISQTYISAMERGSPCGNPSLRILTTLADYFQVQVDTFLLVGGMKALPPGEGDVDPGLGLNQAFERMILHESLCPMGLEKDDLDWFSPKMRRAWVLFAIRAYEAGTEGDPAVAELVNGLRVFEPPKPTKGSG